MVRIRAHILRARESDANDGGLSQSDQDRSVFSGDDNDDDEGGDKRGDRIHRRGFALSRRLTGRT